MKSTHSTFPTAYAISKLGMVVLFFVITNHLQGQMVTEPFAFEFEGKTLNGLIEKPGNQESKAIILLIPGYGKTDFVNGNWFATLRKTLVNAGVTVCFWDKMGCGTSEGIFNAQQPVQNSADEAVAAISEIKKRNLRGSQQIGLWGISRAGWICPLINAQVPIDFWISVSGTDDKENFGYLIKANLQIEGKDEEEVDRLYQAWLSGHKLLSTGGSYERHLKAIRPLLEDSTSRRLFGYPKVSELKASDSSTYAQQQQLYTSNGHFDALSGLWVYLDDFEATLKGINCPVLALFGANDSQVDWRKTKKRYERTLGNSGRATLTTHVFENCNHNLQKCDSCGFQEDLSALNWQACDTYYETMVAWLQLHGLTTH